MGLGKRVSHFAENPRRIVDGQLPFAIEPLAQRFPLHVRHHVPEDPVGAAGIVQQQDVRVLELRRDLDLPQEALGAQRLGQVLAQHLDRHLTVMSLILREVDRRHPARADLAFYDVAVGQGGFQAVDLGGHETKR